MAKIAKKLSQVSQQAMDRLDLPVNLAVVVRVQGEGLELVVMTDEELRINGVIRQLRLVE